MAGLNQGMILKEQKEQKEKKVTQGFTIEGFSGILGSNSDMDSVIASDQTKTDLRSGQFNNNIAQYGTEYDALKKRTKDYLNNADNNYALKKNYNVFINKSVNQDKIATQNIKGCVKLNRGITRNLSVPDGFNEAYPDNFKNYVDAENACKLWAADTPKSLYSLSRDSTGKFRCLTGEAYSGLTQYTKPSLLYSVVNGSRSSQLGGLFGNGQIGVWSGNRGESELPPMTDATLLVKFNSDSYGWGARPVYNRVWGMPTAPLQPYTGWGINYWPTNTDAWWISTNDYFHVGTMGYFYYTYRTAVEKKISVYMVVDDAISAFKVNGIKQTSTSGSWGVGGHMFFNVTLKAGVNIIQVVLVNTGGPGAFVFYASDSPDGNSNVILFTSGPGWVYSKTDNEDDVSNPFRIKTLNQTPIGYEKCNRLIGGGVNKDTIVATFGLNCNNEKKAGIPARFIAVNSNPQNDYIQIAQLAVYSGGRNIAPSGVIGINTAPSWWGTRPQTAIDGTLSPRNHPNIYHSAQALKQQWVLDLGKEYPISQIVYYNRSDCCSHRARGMTIVLVDGGNTKALKTLTLTEALVQRFDV